MIRRKKENKEELISLLWRELDKKTDAVFNSCRKTFRSVKVSLVPPEKPKAQLPKDDVPQFFVVLFNI